MFWSCIGLALLTTAWIIIYLYIYFTALFKIDRVSSYEQKTKLFASTKKK